MLQPGKPQAKLQAVCTAEWERKRLIAYVSGKALVVLSDVDKLLQTIYHDEELCVAAIGETTGKLAVCAGGKVFIYAPNGRGEGFLKWALQSLIELDPSDGNINSLSWGDTDELLVGSSSLTLWSTIATSFSSPSGVKLLWRRPLANPVKLALFCYDASLVASVGEYDRLVKVWRRLSIGSEDVQFDCSYLPHPRAVTAMYWRRPFHREQSIDNVLYTIGADAVLRVWAPVYPHDLHLLQLWAVIDLQESIPGFVSTIGSEGGGGRGKFVVIIDSSVFVVAAETAVNTAGAGDKNKEALQRLIEVANRSPEICVAFDGRGRMSAWGLENVGCKTRKTTNVFSILHTDNSGMEGMGEGGEGGEGGFVQFHVFAGGAGLTILAHVFDGRIYWFESRLDHLLDPSPKGKRFELMRIFSGHSKPIETLVRTADGKAMLTLTRDDEHIVWTQPRGDNVNLVRQSTLAPGEHVHRAVVLDGGNFVMTLHHGHVILWNTSQQTATEVSRLPFTCCGKPLCLLLLPEAEDSLRRAHVVALSSEMKGVAWEIGLPRGQANRSTGSALLRAPYLREFSRFSLNQKDDLLMIMPVDPVGWNAKLSATLDTFSREVAITVNGSGLLQSWTARIEQDGGEESSLRWLATSTVDTSIPSPSLAKGNSIRKIALVNADRSELTIWDSRAAQLEYRRHFESQDVIRDLDWTSTPDSQSILAVGFPHRVVLMCQLRYDYLNAGPAWAPFREVKIRDLTPHPIGDSLWLSNGGLVIGAGNQLFVYSRKIEQRDDLVRTLQLNSHKARLDDIFEIVSQLNGPVPVYHPQFLQQCILAGKHALVEEVLVRLHKELRGYHEEIPLDNFLDIPVERFLESGGVAGRTVRRQKFSGFFNYTEDEDEFSTFDEALAGSLCELLKKIAIPHLTGTEQIMLAGIVECVAQVKLHRRSIDENGARYMLFFRQHGLRREKPAVDMSFREVVWAFHSASQEILVDLVNRNAQGRMLWAQARESGIFMWLRDADAVRRQFEVVARNAYTSTDDRNPVDCSLHYLALKKKGVLLGLWRMAGWNREQGATTRFLGNDFKTGKWKTAAMKNAYALLGKHRFEYAAAFFLLADSLGDAVNVCFDRMKDMQLAIAIARVYEGGDDGPVLKGLLEDRILPLATKEGNHWLATWAFWMLKRKDKAVESLLSPLPSLMTTTHVHIESRFFTADDPALIILYQQIREKTLQTLRGAAKISPAAESQFVLHTARLYDRMGCDLLALELVKNWSFLPADRDTMKPLIQLDPRRHHMRRRSSVTIADLPQVDEKPQPQLQSQLQTQTQTQTQMHMAGLAQPPAAMFEEPDMSWAF